MGFGDVLRGHGEGGFDQHDPPPDGGRPLSEAVLADPAGAETLEHEFSTHRVLCDLPQLSALDMTFRPGFEGVDPHIHRDHADCFYVLEGDIEFRVGDEPRVAGPGTFVAAPPGSVHGFQLADDNPIRFLNLHAPPGGFLERLRANG
jgi:quercetin dioxygenase-like cupin family protein